MGKIQHVILFDGPERINLLPLTYTRPVCEIRIGIVTIKEKWDILLDTSCSYATEEYLMDKFQIKNSQDNLWINGSIPGL